MYISGNDESDGFIEDKRELLKFLIMKYRWFRETVRLSCQYTKSLLPCLRNCLNILRKNHNSFLAVIVRLRSY